jgi:hypothetical protein
VRATSEVAAGTDRVGRQRSLLREGGYERGVGADDCFSSKASVSEERAQTLARTMSGNVTLFDLRAAHGDL